MKIPQLTFTRFIAAIGIVFFHFARKLPEFKDWFIFQKASIGVSFFFILSGFVMIVAYSDRFRGALSYYKNRFARIYPVYLLALIIMAAYLFMTNGFEDQNIFLCLLGLQAWFPAHAQDVNYPAWSLSVEFFFYLLFPLLFRMKKKHFVILALCVWIVSQINIFILGKFDYGESYTKFIFYSPVWHINEFLIGMAGGYFFMEHKKSMFANYDKILAGLFIILIAVLYFAPLTANIHDGMLAILFVPAIVLLAQNTGRITKVFLWKLFEFLGEISYSIYILQVPVYTLGISFLKRIGITGHYLVLFILMIALIIASSLSYLFIEKPVRNAIKNFEFRKLRPSTVTQ